MLKAFVGTERWCCCRVPRAGWNGRPERPPHKELRRALTAETDDNRATLGGGDGVRSKEILKSMRLSVDGDGLSEHFRGLVVEVVEAGDVL